MADTAIAYPARSVAEQKTGLSCRALFYIAYSVVPITILVVLLDCLFLDYQIKDAVLPTGIKLAFISYYISFPHVVASMMGFADTHYVRHYRKHLFFSFVISGAAAFVVVTQVSLLANTLIVVFCSSYHAAMQQFGISLMAQGQTLGRTTRQWKIITGVFLVYVMLLAGFEKYLSPEFLAVHVGVVSLIGIASLYYFFRIAPGITSNIGRYYFLGDLLVVVSCYIFWMAGYHVFAFILPVLVHSLMAYPVYIFHDQNRNRDSAANIIYRLPKALRIPPGLFVLIASLIIGYMLVQSRSWPIYMMVFWHCIMESYMWKRGTPHREQVMFLKD